MFSKVLKTLYTTLHTTTAAVVTVGLAGVLGLVYITNPISATLNATTFNTTPQTINSGTLSLAMVPGVGQTQTSAGFTSYVSGMIPGDIQNRSVDYTQAATNATALSPTLQITDGSSGAAGLLSADSVRGASLTITNCSVAWTFTLGSPAQSCTGISTPALNATPLTTLKSATGLASGFQLTAGAISHLQYAITFPAGVNETTTNGTSVVGSSPYAITAIAPAAGTVTYSTASTTNLAVGELITVSGATIAGYNGTFVITAVVPSTSFSATNATTGATSSATGTLPTAQNLSSTITWTVSEAQRAAIQNNG